jgi:transposase InsO family protein
VTADAFSREKRDVPQADVELVLSMQRPWRQDEKRDSRDWVRLPMRPAQLWVDDITYVTVIGGFAYVAVVLDAWSRRVVGYAISRSIDVRLTLAALAAAIEGRKAPTGCVHHSDRPICRDSLSRSPCHLRPGWLHGPARQSL